METDDIYKDMASNPELYDFSNYPPEHPLFSKVNEKKIGLMKDETAGVPICEFCGLRAKLYSICIGCNGELKRAKGVKKTTIKKKLRHQDYGTVLESSGLLRAKMTMFRNNKHKLSTVVVNKVALSAYDDKRYLLDDGVTSLAYGHKRIPNGAQEETPSVEEVVIDDVGGEVAETF